MSIKKDLIPGQIRRVASSLVEDNVLAYFLKKSSVHFRNLEIFIHTMASASVDESVVAAFDTVYSLTSTKALSAITSKDNTNPALPSSSHRGNCKIFRCTPDRDSLSGTIWQSASFRAPPSLPSQKWGLSRLVPSQGFKSTASCGLSDSVASHEVLLPRHVSLRGHARHCRRQARAIWGLRCMESEANRWASCGGR